MSGALGEQFTEKFFIEAPQFSAAAPADASRARLPLKTETGETVGWFSWNPDRPGALILSETLPAMLGALAIVGFVLA